VARLSGVRWLVAALIIATGILNGAAQSEDGPPLQGAPLVIPVDAPHAQRQPPFTAIVAGSIINARGTVAGVTVFLNERATSRAIGPVTTDKKGAFEIRYVRAGQYTVFVTLDDRRQAVSDVFTVRDRERVSVPKLTLVERGSVTGSVADAQGKPLAARVALASETRRDTRLASVTTDAHGDYTVPNVPPDTYTLSINPTEGFVQLDRLHVRVADGERVQIPRITLEPKPVPGIPARVRNSMPILAPSSSSGAAQGADAGTVSGSVVDAQGVIPGAKVVLTSESDASRRIGPILTDKDGAWKLDVPAGRYTLSVTLAGYYALTRRNIDVHDGDRVVVPQLTLHAGSAPPTAGDGPMVVGPIPDAPTIPGDHNGWILQVLGRIEAIKPGMTRRDLLKVFIPGGGIFNRSRRSYVAADCPYIKVDVEFRPLGPDETSEGNLDDVVVAISRPFIQRPISD